MNMQTTQERELSNVKFPPTPQYPKSFEERQKLRQAKKYRTMEEVYGPNFLRENKINK